MDDPHRAASHVSINKAKLLMRRWTIHHLKKELGAHVPAWDALNRQLFNAHPTLSSRFVNCLLKHFGDGSERLCILTVEGEPRAMGIFKPSSPGIWATFLPAQAQVGPLLCKTADELRSLVPRLPGFVVRLDLLCCDPALIELPGAEHATIQTTNHALTMAICLDGGFENYWGSRHKKLVQNIGRYERRLKADGHTRKSRQIDALREVSTAIERYSALELLGWKAAQGTAVKMSDSQGAFYSEISSFFAETGEARVYELWFDDQLVASRLAIAAGQMIVMLKTTYDETQSKYSPGRLLLHDAIQNILNTTPGIDIEFYTDANADQLAWATGSRWIKHASLYRSALVANVFRRMKQTARFLRAKGAPGPVAIAPLTVSAYRHPDEFPQAVQQFFSEAAATDVERGAHWYRNLINAVFTGNDGVRFYVLLDGDRPVAALPILIKKGVRGNTVEALGNYYTSLYAPLLAAEADVGRLAHLVAAIKVAHAPVTSLRFAPMDPDSSGYGSLFSALNENGFGSFKFFCFGNWYEKVKNDWPTYLSTRDGTVRSTIKRMGKKFASNGGKLEMFRGGDDLDRGIAAYLHVYALSWKQAEPYPNFVPGLIRTCAEEGMLRLGVAWLGEQPIAAQIWIVTHNKANIYKLAYDESFKAYAPGTLLTAMLMEHAIDVDKVQEIDYLIGDDPYKAAWMSQRRERWGIIAFNPKTFHGLVGLSKEFLGRTIKLIIGHIQTLRNPKPIERLEH